jgi:hypothetical protein
MGAVPANEHDRKYEQKQGRQYSGEHVNHIGSPIILWTERNQNRRYNSGDKTHKANHK